MANITVYTLDRYGIYQGDSREIDSRDPIPPQHTSIEPPSEIPDGSVAQLRGRRWHLVSGPSDADLAREKQQQKARVAAVRYQKETAGITKDGISIATDDRSKSLLSGKALKASRDDTVTAQWKTSGGWVTLDATQILAISDAVDAYVQECFDREAAIGNEIDGGTYEPSMLYQGWPSRQR